MLNELTEKMKLERWKETPLKKILAISWDSAPKCSELIQSPVLFPEDSIVITFNNGQLDSRWFNTSQLPDGLLFQVQENHLALRLMPHTQIERPLILHHIIHGEAGKNLLSTFSLELILEEGAAACLAYVESGQGKCFFAPGFNVTLKNNAQLNWLSVVRAIPEGNSLSTFNCIQHAHSHFSWVSYQSRGAVIRSDIDVSLHGEGAHSEFYALNMGQAQQHIASVVNFNHTVPHCSSISNIRNLLADQAFSLFDGMIHVDPQAQKTDAEQLTNSILLCDEARAMTVPRLEIYADDVRCTHGATVGSLDSEALFYLQSRGLSKREAELMLIRAYVTAPVEKIKSLALRTWLFEFLEDDLSAIN